MELVYSYTLRKHNTFTVMYFPLGVCNCLAKKPHNESDSGNSIQHATSLIAQSPTKPPLTCMMKAVPFYAILTVSGLHTWSSGDHFQL